MIIGHFTTMFLWSLASFSPSSIIADASVATTSALIGPSTISQISFSTSWYGRPVLAMSDGLVVTPSMSPQLAASRISATSAVSIKYFIGWMPLVWVVV